MNTETIAALAIGALVSLIVGGLWSAIGKWMGRRVYLRSPEARSIEQIGPAVNALVKVASPQNDALIAILEAQKGVCNGNVDRALEKMRKTRDEFHGFLVSSALVDKEAS